jgi:uncharacterized membrane protein
MKKLHQAILFFSAFCLLLNTYHIFIFHSFYPAYLLWNLFLAYIPYVLAICFARSVKNRKPRWKQITFLLGWLVFFPNTIYLLTDFVHLYEQTYLPVWFDIVELFSFSFIACLFGFLSLYTIEKVLTKKIGFRRSFIFIITAIVLANIGVYLGRNLRWNSWDLFIQPWYILVDFISIFTHWKSFLNFTGMVLVFSGMFIGVYFSLRALVQSKEK